MKTTHTLFRNNLIVELVWYCIILHWSPSFLDYFITSFWNDCPPMSRMHLSDVNSWTVSGSCWTCLRSVVKSSVFQGVGFLYQCKNLRLLSLPWEVIRQPALVVSIIIQKPMNGFYWKSPGLLIRGQEKDVSIFMMFLIPEWFWPSNL